MVDFEKAIKEYQAIGLKVLPLDGKIPREIGWHKRAFSSEQILQLLSTYSRPGIGVQMGPVSGIIDFEYDSPAQRRALYKLFKGHEHLLETCPCFESNHGRHFIFKWDNRLEATNAGNLYLPCDNGEKLVVRIGAASKGSQSAFPPSPGKAWMQDRSILDAPLLRANI